MAALALLVTTHADASLAPRVVKVSICYRDAKPEHCIPAQTGKVTQTTGNAKNTNGQLVDKSKGRKKPGKVTAATPNIDCPDKCTEQLNANMTTITLKAWEKQGKYQLKQWVGNCKNARQTNASNTTAPKTCVVDVDAKVVTVKAVFKQYDPSYPDQGP